jgi:hypothetical protein
MACWLQLTAQVSRGFFFGALPLLGYTLPRSGFHPLRNGDLYFGAGLYSNRANLGAPRSRPGGQAADPGVRPGVRPTFDNLTRKQHS